jgi:hypothetical protein
MVVYLIRNPNAVCAGIMAGTPKHGGIQMVESKQELIEERLIPYLYRNHPEAMHDVKRGTWGDVWADLGTHTLAIQVWDPGTPFSELAANAIIEARKHQDTVPVVAVPAGWADPTGVMAFRERGVLVWELQDE